MGETEKEQKLKQEDAQNEQIKEMGTGGSGQSQFQKA